jgi:prefoldin subunit 5
MECLTSKETINNTVEAVSNVSYSEKREALLTEVEINKFLDDYLELCHILAKKTESVNTVNETLERLFNLTELNEDCLRLLNVLVSVGRDFYITLDKQYQNIIHLVDHKIAVNEICNFKEAIDYLQESIDDLESIFLTLPKSADFVEVTKKLSSM